MKSFLEPLLKAIQNRLHHGRSNTTQILAITRIVKEIQINNCIPLANSHKAFNGIHCEKMVKILWVYGIPETSSKCYQPVISMGTEAFETLAGVL